MTNTIGDRLNQLLRERGRQDRGKQYNQNELVEMLNGRMKAPDGNYYHVATNKSTLNRIFTDKQELPHDVLFAICDMFTIDTEWILRGKKLETGTLSRFKTDEANEVGAILDDMSPRSRQVVLVLAQELQKMDHQ